MKYTKILFAGMLAAATLSGCSDDSDPKYQEPAPIMLAAPTEPTELTPDGQVSLQCTAPDYGFQAATSYVVDVSLSADFKSVAQMDDGTGAAPDSVTLSTIYNSPAIQVSDVELAKAMCVLNGVTAEENYVDKGFEPVYVKVRAYISAITDRSMVASNTATMNLKGFFVASGPAGPEQIYVPGDGSGWAFTFKLMPDAKYENYTGFAVLKGSFKFSDSPNWDGQNWGAGATAGSLAPNAGNIPVDKAGLYWISFNYPKTTYKLTYVESIALVGDFNGWNEKTGQEMTPDGSGDDVNYAKWTTPGVSGGYKFVMNHGWNLNLGGSIDDLTVGGDNLTGPGDSKVITLNLGAVPYTCTYDDK